MKKLLPLIVALLAMPAIAQVSKTRVAEPMSKAVATQQKQFQLNGAPKVIGTIASPFAPIAKVNKAEEETAPTVYYTMPAGTFYNGFTKDWYAYNNTVLQVPCWTNFSFEDCSPNPSASKWYMGDDELTETVADNKCTLSLSPGYYFPSTPKLVNGEEEFMLGVSSTNEETGTTYNPIIQTTDTILALAACDHNRGFYYGSGVITPLVTDGVKYFWGTGTYDATEQGYGELTCMGVRQVYAKPLSPMFVEDIHIMALTNSDVAIAPGSELDLFVVNSETGETTAMLTATSEDVLDFEQSQGGFNYCTLQFKQRVEVDGVEYEMPLTIDYPFYLQLQGLDGDGIDVGFYGNEVVLGESEDNSSDILFTYGTKILSMSYSALTVPFTFNAMFDGINVWDAVATDNGDVEMANVLNVSEDGQTCTSRKLAGFDVDGVIVETVQPWLNPTTGDENYYLVNEGAEWVESASATYNDEFKAYIVKVVCSPLEGTTGRVAKIHFDGNGVESSDIVVTQGEVSDADAIDYVSATPVKTSSKAYNLRGQRINANAKGIVIANGKKFFNK